MKETKFARIQHIPHYVSQLRQAIGLYLGYIIPPSFAQEAFEAIQQDPTVQHAINYLSLLSAGRDWYIDAQGKEYQPSAKCVEEGLRMINDFTHARKSLAMGALYGMSLLKKDWQQEACELGGIKGNWWVCKSLSEVDPRRIRIERDTEDRNCCYWTLWTPEEDRYIILEDRAKNSNAKNAMQDYIWYFSEFSELQAGYGLGLGHVLWSICHIKSKVLQYRAELAETWARPWVIAKIDLLMGVLNDSAMTGHFPAINSRVSDILDVLEKMRGRHILAVPSQGQDELDIKEAGSSSDNMMNSFLEYLDKSITTLILGSTLNTQEGNAGSYAQSKVHESSTDAVVSYHRERIEEALTRDLVDDFIQRNKLLLIRAGIPQKGQLQYKIRDPRQSESKKQEKQQALPIALQMQLPLKKSEVYETLGFSIPTDDDDLFQSPQQQFQQQSQNGSQGGLPFQAPFPFLLSKLNGKDPLQKLLKI